MLSLPNTTLFCADCVDAERAIRIIEICKSRCQFGAVKLLTSLPTDYQHAQTIRHLGTHNDYSSFMVSKAHEYIDTSHMLVVQHDGFILNPEAWVDRWASYDYIGPLFIHRHEINARSVGSGGFSYRSTELMRALASSVPEWPDSMSGNEYQTNMLTCYEDGMISMDRRDFLESRGFTYATPHEAAQFAFGGQCSPAYVVERPFGFHGLWSVIDYENCRVTGPDPHSPSYQP